MRSLKAVFNQGQDVCGVIVYTQRLLTTGLIVQASAQHVSDSAAGPDNHKDPGRGNPKIPWGYEVLTAKRPCESVSRLRAEAAHR